MLPALKERMTVVVLSIRPSSTLAVNERSQMKVMSNNECAD